MSNETKPVTPGGRFPILVLFNPYTTVSWNASSVPDVSWLKAGAAMASMAMAPIVIPAIWLRGDLLIFFTPFDLHVMLHSMRGFACYIARHARVRIRTCYS